MRGIFRAIVGRKFKDVTQGAGEKRERGEKKERYLCGQYTAPTAFSSKLVGDCKGRRKRGKERRLAMKFRCILGLVEALREGNKGG